MTSQFSEGQEVEVFVTITPPAYGGWRKAKIVRLPHAPNALDDGRKYTVQFLDGSRAMFGAEYIRTDDKIPTKDHLRLGKEIGLLW